MDNDRQHAFFIRSVVESKDEIERMKADLLGARVESDLPVEDQLAIAKRQLELQDQVIDKYKNAANLSTQKFNQLQLNLECTLRRAQVDLDMAAAERPSLQKAMDRLDIPPGGLSLMQQIQVLAKLAIEARRRSSSRRSSSNGQPAKTLGEAVREMMGWDPISGLPIGWSSALDLSMPRTPCPPQIKPK